MLWWFQGWIDFKLVLCKLEIHLSNICCISGQHYSCLNFCHCNCSQVGLNCYLYKKFIMKVWPSLICRLETLDLQNSRGIAKLLGTMVSLAGVTIMTVYKGPIMRNLLYSHQIHIQGNTPIHEHWLKGSILTIASCITWSIWYIMQVHFQLNQNSNILF